MLTIDELGAEDAALVHQLDPAQGASVHAFPTRRLTVTEGAAVPARPSLLQRESLHRRLLGVADLVAATIAMLGAMLASDVTDLEFAALLGAPLVVVLFKIAGLYDRDQMRIAHSTLDEAPALLQLTGLFALGATIAAPALGASDFPAGQIAVLWGAAFLTTLGGRMAARWIARRLLPEERCLIIGEPDVVGRIRSKLASSHARATVVAALPLDSDELDRFRGPESLQWLVSQLSLDRVIIAPDATDTQAVVELIRVAKAAGVRVSVLPRMFEAVGSAVEFDDVDGLTMVGVRPFGLARSSRLLKRGFDLAATSLGMIAVAPILALVAVAIKLDSRGPVLFRQVRVGRDGEPFEIFKFRSMCVDAEDRKDELRQLNEVGDGMFKITSDPRVTRVGAILRRTSLDEMPQLLNVMRGEMSLVGPRPLVTDEDAQVHGMDRSRLHLTPGMTGPWQVLGSRVPMQEMVAIDYLYVASWSLWADVKLLLRTIRHVARRGNV
jgi:exopolysaccharide biosynthesis polyprenyl glycosylphosphotransferase